MLGPLICYAIGTGAALYLFLKWLYGAGPPWVIRTLGIAACFILSWATLGFIRILFGSHIALSTRFLMEFWGDNLGCVGAGMLITLFLSGEGEFAFRYNQIPPSQGSNEVPR